MSVKGTRTARAGVSDRGRLHATSLEQQGRVDGGEDAEKNAGECGESEVRDDPAAAT